MKTGDKVICKETINNVLGMPLFEKDKEYEILGFRCPAKMYYDEYDENDVDVEIILNHNLYANEYTEWDMEFFKENFELKK
jgi:hypothetical protein